MLIRFEKKFWKDCTFSGKSRKNQLYVYKIFTNCYVKQWWIIFDEINISNTILDFVLFK